MYASTKSRMFDNKDSGLTEVELKIYKKKEEEYKKKKKEWIESWEDKFKCYLSFINIRQFKGCEKRCITILDFKEEGYDYKLLPIALTRSTERIYFF